jgi:dihydrodipicolinate synthase/N-acetylneuraminate lyase
MSTKETDPIRTLVGFATALPTPFSGEAIDEKSFAALCDWQIAHGIAALVAGDVDRTQRLRHVLGEEFRLFAGDDAAALDCLVRGGDGCISVVANVAPRTCVELHDAWRNGEPAEARLMARTLAPLIAALFAESSPVPVKYALSLLGRISEDVRLPLCPASSMTQVVVTRALERFGLLSAAPRKSLQRRSVVSAHGG